jgi:hypothetical protein
MKQNGHWYTIAVFASPPHIAYGIQKTQADPGSLPFWHNNQLAGPRFVT